MGTMTSSPGPASKWPWPGEWKRNFPFYFWRIIGEWNGWVKGERGKRERESAYSYVESFVMHFVEMEDRAITVWWDETLNYAKTVLCLSAVF